ncbi:putative toxin-antitoxin system toxin component, PIN family [Conexibacter sp. CPCC 206217]|uniref:putative toxin-antitoxin system toxin component, PIN family n=1 Tax=Conexibacter sp. CPCC 206217 TaxID=3064574 RepID=UPI0027242BB2|nr:putative toxin-antitoxin system toxin component, PIN family [Conexibacter sp. CPCC 206217]MDO8213482.1 putative toxin-antitoxin system toxin component, PIN family [Conexibacter sp. CPCC 206217]
MRRLVLDTSVLLSAFVGAPTSPPGRLLAAARAGAFEIAACPLIFEELRRGLSKPYFSARVRESEAVELLDALGLLAVVAPDPVSPTSVLRDPTDDFLVALAIATGVDAIVTSDRDLLDHAGLRPPAINARAACELLGI